MCLGLQPQEERASKFNFVLSRIELSKDTVYFNTFYIECLCVFYFYRIETGEVFHYRWFTVRNKLLQCSFVETIRACLVGLNCASWPWRRQLWTNSCLKRVCSCALRRGRLLTQSDREHWHLWLNRGSVFCCWMNYRAAAKEMWLLSHACFTHWMTDVNNRSGYSDLILLTNK